MPTIAAERTTYGKPRMPIRILGSVRATNMARIASLIPDGYTAPTPQVFRAEVRLLGELAERAADGRTGAVTLSDGSRIVTRCL